VPDDFSGILYLLRSRRSLVRAQPGVLLNPSAATICIRFVFCGLGLFFGDCARGVLKACLEPFYRSIPGCGSCGRDVVAVETLHLTFVAVRFHPDTLRAPANQFSDGRSPEVMTRPYLLFTVFERRRRAQ